MKEIVGTFNEDFSKIIFYEILFHVKNITVLKIQGSDSFNYCAYDNKNHIFGKFPLFGTTNEIKPEDVEKLKICWSPRLHLFFWADSRFVKDYGLPYYDKLVSLYKQMYTVRLQEEELNKLLLQTEYDNIFQRIYFKIRVRLFNIKRRKALSKVERELKIIW